MTIGQTYCLPFRTGLIRLCALALVLFFGMTARAQQVATATIEGVVTDPNGAVVQGAKVTATNTATGFTRIISTDDSGIFRLPLLPPGTYSITAAAQGFAENKYGSVILTVGQKLNLELMLRVNVSESVTVTSGAPVVETSRTNFSGSVDSKAVSDLPINGRNFLDFATLTPGVVKDPTRGGDLSFGGQRGPLNSLLVDGVDNNNLFFGQALGRAGFRPYQFSQDAVQEFQVNTSTFSAEFGRAAGGITNVVTKSGTNDFHGTGFWYYRDRGLNANSLAFNAGRNALLPAAVKPPYHFNQFGGNIGGPIKKNRAFFFFNYDGQRNQTNNIVAFGATAPSDAASQAAAARLAQFGATYPRGANQDVYLGKVDIQLSEQNQLGVRYNRQNFTGTNFENGGGTTARERTGDSLITTDTLTVSLNTAFTPRFLNEFRTNIGRDKQPGKANSDDPEAEIRQGGQVYIVIGRNNFSPRETTEEKYQIIDNVTWIANKHSLKGGVDVNIEKIKNFFPGFFGGQYLFNSLADFTNNRVSRFTQNFGGTGTSGPLTYPNFNEYSFFLQDDWRPFTSLTLNFGVRYDIQRLAQPPTFNPSPALAAAGIRTNYIKHDMNNVAPRFGFAWRPGVTDKFVVRGGYGLFYGRTPAIMLAQSHSNNGVNVLSVTLNNPTLPFAYPGRFNALDDILRVGGTASTPSIYVFDKNYEQPYTQQASLGWEYELMRDLSIGASYLFVKGTQLQRTRDINLLAPVSTPIAGGPNFLRHPGAQGNPTRPIAGFTRISQFESTANSNYNGLVLEVKKRLSRNFQLQGSYTWSKVLDDAPDATSVVAFNAGDDAKQAQQSLNLRDEWGPGVSNIPHRLVASGSWDLAYFSGLNRAARQIVDGWQLSAIYQLNYNAPFSTRIGATDLNNDSNSNSDRAPGFGRNSNRIGNFSSLDFRVAKSFFLTEKVRLQFFGEFFNLFNRMNKTNFDPQLYRVNGIGTTGVSLTQRAEFGTPRAIVDPRIGQIALKLIF